MCGLSRCPYYCQVSTLTGFTVLLDWYTDYILYINLIARNLVVMSVFISEQ